MQPGDILPLAFDRGLVGLSFIISALGAYVALFAAGRIRSAEGGVNVGYVAVAAVALGAVGIWGMHFIGMMAQVIPVGVSYGLMPTLLSLLVALGFSGAALWYVGSAAFSIRRCLIAGVLAGLGIAGMHYLGMGSMRMPAYVEWDIELVATSVVIAIFAASVALWMAFNLHSERQRIGAAIVMAVAVCGMHYTGAAAGTLICTTPRVFDGPQFDASVLPYAVFLVSVVALIVMRVELQRSSYENWRKISARMEKVLHARR